MMGDVIERGWKRDCGEPTLSRERARVTDPVWIARKKKKTVIQGFIGGQNRHRLALISRSARQPVFACDTTINIPGYHSFRGRNAS